MAVQHAKGLCGEEEDFVKSFLPSLFESDSESDDAYWMEVQNKQNLPSASSLPSQRLHVHTSKPMKKTTSCEAFSQATSMKLKQNHPNTSNASKEDCCSSPLSQGTSSTLTPFQTSKLESHDSLDTSSAFCSVLSFESSDSAFEFNSTPSFMDGHSPIKKQKVANTLPLAASREAASAPVTPARFISKPVMPTRKLDLSPCQSMASPCTPQLRSKSSQSFTSPHAYANTAKLPSFVTYPRGGVTTGIPVDSCSPGVGKTWQGQTAMIPTGPTTTSYTQHSLMSHVPTPPHTFERVSAALADIKNNPTVNLPIGLNLDRSSVVLGLKSIGMTLKD